jgi:hypothetical protein
LAHAALLVMLSAGGPIAPTVCPASEAVDPNAPVVIVAVGAEGSPEYSPQFSHWADLWRQAAAKGGAKFVAIGLDDAVGDPCDRDRLRAALAEQASPATGPLWLVLIGHGTFDGRTAKFNLRGPDLSAEDLAGWLKPVSRPIAVIDTTCASSPFLKALSAPGRVVVTATKSGFEQSITRFGQFLAEAITDPNADLDKDGQTSLLEAFLSASSRVRGFYSASGRLATEHALLDDNGDGLGTPADWFRGIRPTKKASDNASLDGYRAHQLHLLCSPSEAGLSPELRAQRDRLELEVMGLRDNRASLTDDQYYAKLESLLRTIGQIYDQARPWADSGGIH